MDGRDAKDQPSKRFTTLASVYRTSDPASLDEQKKKNQSAIYVNRGCLVDRKDRLKEGPIHNFVHDSWQLDGNLSSEIAILMVHPLLHLTHLSHRLYPLNLQT